MSLFKGVDGRATGGFDDFGISKIQQQEPPPCVFYIHLTPQQQMGGQLQPHPKQK